MTKRAIIYARVSSDDSKKDGINLQSQVDMAIAYCNEHDYTIIETFSESDKGASGASIDLPRLNQVRDMALHKQFDVLVVREIDRLSRSLAKQLIIEDELQKYGVSIDYVLASYENSPEGRLNKHIRATIAEYEREKINERMTRGRQNKVKMGGVMFAGNRPYGFEIVTIGKIQTLKVIDKEASIIRLIFHWYTFEKLSVDKITKRLTDQSIPTLSDTQTSGINRAKRKKRDFGHWSPATVLRILSRELYASGVWHYGQHNLEVTGLPTIITPELFNLAAKQRKANFKNSKRNTVHEYLVSKRVTCGQCDCKMNAQSRKYKTTIYQYYRCPATEKRAYVTECDNRHSFRSQDIDNAVWGFIVKLFDNPDYLDEKLLEIWNQDDNNIAPLIRQRDTTNELISQHQNSFDNLRLAIKQMKNPIAVSSLSDDLDTEANTIDALRNELVTIERKIESQRRITLPQLNNIRELCETTGFEIKSIEDFNAKCTLVNDFNISVVLTYDKQHKQRHLTISCTLGDFDLSVDNHDTYNGSCNTQITITEVLIV